MLLCSVKITKTKVSYRQNHTILYNLMHLVECYDILLISRQTNNNAECWTMCISSNVNQKSENLKLYSFWPFRSELLSTVDTNVTCHCHKSKVGHTLYLCVASCSHHHLFGLWACGRWQHNAPGHSKSDILVTTAYFSQVNLGTLVTTNPIRWEWTVW